MWRRDFFAVFGSVLIGASAAWPPTVRAREAGDARVGRAFEKIKRDYGKRSHSSEAARADYISRLVRLREQAIRGNSDECKATDAGIKQHPGAGRFRQQGFDCTSRRRLGIAAARLSLSVGRNLDHAGGGSGRYARYLAHRGNRHFDGAAMEAPKMDRYAIIILDKRDFIFTSSTKHGKNSAVADDCVE